MTDHLTTILVLNGFRMAVRFSPSKGVVSLHKFDNGKWVVADRAWRTDRDSYRYQIKSRLSDGAVLESTSEADIEDGSYVERDRVFNTLYDRANENLGTRAATRVRYGFNKLEKQESERLPKLYASVNAGRIDDVIDALIKYYGK